MKLISAFTPKFLLLIFVFLPLLCVGQGKFIPSGFRFGADIPRLAITAFDKQRTQYEFQADVDFHRFFLAFDYGIYKRTRDNNNFSYTSEGMYYKAGPDINILKSQWHKHQLFFGARYAMSNFSDRIDQELEDTYWGNQLISAKNNRVNASWIELVTGLKVRIWHEFYLGYTLRFKFFKNEKGAGSLAPYDIPGYGLAEHNSAWGINYYIFYRIPFRKK